LTTGQMITETITAHSRQNFTHPPEISSGIVCPEHLSGMLDCPALFDAESDQGREKDFFRSRSVSAFRGNAGFILRNPVMFPVVRRAFIRRKPIQPNIIQSVRIVFIAFTITRQKPSRPSGVFAFHQQGAADIGVCCIHEIGIQIPQVFAVIECETPGVTCSAAPWKIVVQLIVSVAYEMHVGIEDIIGLVETSTGDAEDNPNHCHRKIGDGSADPVIIHGNLLTMKMFHAKQLVLSSGLECRKKNSLSMSQ
jgi:hypothetical protein